GVPLRKRLRSHPLNLIRVMPAKEVDVQAPSWGIEPVPERLRVLGFFDTMLALAALIGADARVPSMVLQRAPLGRRGSYVATVLNVAQCMGWAIFELI